MAGKAKPPPPALLIQELVESFGLSQRVAKVLCIKHRIKTLKHLEEFYRERGRLGHVLAIGDVLSVRAALDALQQEPAFSVRAVALLGQINEEIDAGSVEGQAP